MPRRRAVRSDPIRAPRLPRDPWATGNTESPGGVQAARIRLESGGGGNRGPCYPAPKNPRPILFALRPIVRRPLASSDRLPGDLHPLLRRVYLGRGVTAPDELDLSLAGLAPLDRLGNLQAAVDALHRTMARGDAILVVGDYDADGATSTALAIRGLGALGAAKRGFLVPNRFTEGYGLTPALVDQAGRRGARLILTVDNGISSLAGVERARALGIPVVVTDHHLPGGRLPEAVILNPNLPGDPFPSKHLAGVGVLFYLLAGLRRHLREVGWFDARGIPEPNLAEHLDLVALGTVADLVTLDRNNRILVEQGLRRVRAGRACAGVRALFAAAGRNPETATSQDLAFGVAPRLNAAGRLADMSLGIRCLLSEDPALARELAGRLDGLNRERRQIEAEMRERAEGLVDALALAEAELPAGLCLFDPEWHQGVIGILASRLVARHHRPVIAFAPGGAGELKGSARSVAALHMRDALAAVATEAPDLILRFGGHAMAAGLAIPGRRLVEFSACFEAEVERRLDGRDPTGILASDGVVDAEHWRLEAALALRRGGPWGQGFPEPLFDDHFQVLERRLLGERHLKLRVRPAGTDLNLEAIAFDQAEQATSLADGDWRHLAFSMDVNQFQDTQRLQLRVEQLAAPGEGAAA